MKMASNMRWRGGRMRVARMAFILFRLGKIPCIAIPYRFGPS